MGLGKRVRLLARIYKRAGVTPWLFGIQMLGNAVTSALEGVKVALLLPLGYGLIRHDFSFLRGLVWLRLPGPFQEAAASGGDRPLFFALAGVLVVVVIAKSAFLFVFLKYFSLRRMEYQHRLNAEIFDRYLTYGKRFFDQRSMGELRQAFGFVHQVFQFLEGINGSMRDALTLAVYAIVMFIVSWPMALAVGAGMTVLYMIFEPGMQRIRRISKDQVRAGRAWEQHLYGFFTTHELTLAYEQQDFERQRFSGLLRAEEALGLRTFMERYRMRRAQETGAVFFLLGIIYMIAFVFAPSSDYETTVYLLFLYLAQGVMARTGWILSRFASFAELDEPMRQLMEILSRRQEYEVTGGARRFEGLRDGIRIRGLDFSYTSDRRALKGLDADFLKGKVSALVGPTGAGKSTIAALLMRFYTCPRGMIFVDGVDLCDLEIASWRQRISFVSQNVLIAPGTIGENITYSVPSPVSDARIREVLRQTQLLDFVAGLPLGLDTPVGDVGTLLSGGERQRIAIARALLKDPEILILDEATSSLDSLTEKEVQAAIRSAVVGRTAIVIAHRLSTIQNADCIYVVEHGQCREKGALGELLKRQGTFYHLWQAQQFD